MAFPNRASTIFRVLLRTLWCVALVVVPVLAPSLREAQPIIPEANVFLSSVLVLCLLMSHSLMALLLLVCVGIHVIVAPAGNAAIISVYALSALGALGLAVPGLLLSAQARALLTGSSIISWLRPALFFAALLLTIPVYFEIATPWPSILLCPWCLLLWASLPRDKPLLREMAHGALLTISSTTILLLTAELGARLLFQAPPDDTLLRPHHERLFELSPGASRVFRLPEFYVPPFRSSISSQGLRDKEYGPKPSGTLRIVALGDSMVYGWGASREESFPGKLEASLRETLHDTVTEVVNAGTPGYGPWQSLSWLRERCETFQPDAVLYVLNLANDPSNELYRAGMRLRCYNVEWEGVLRRYERANSFAGRVDQALRNHSRLYQVWGHAMGKLEYPLLLAAQSLRANRVEPLAHPESGMTDMEFHRVAWYQELESAVDLVAESIAAMQDWCNMRGIAFFVALLPSHPAVCEPAYLSLQWRCPWETLPYNQIIETTVFETALMERGIETLALQELFRSHPDSCGLYIPYDGHLSEVGNHEAAQACAGLITHRLGGALSSRGRPPVATP